MGSISDAKRILNYYLSKAWESCGLTWDSDNEAEVNGLVDDLINGIKKDLSAENYEEYER